MSLASITKVGDVYVLDFNNRTVTVDVDDIRKRLARPQDTIAQMEVKANAWLDTQADGAEVLRVHIFSETPPAIAIGRFYKGNAIPDDWWAE